MIYAVRRFDSSPVLVTKGVGHMLLFRLSLANCLDLFVFEAELILPISRYTVGGDYPSRQSDIETGGKRRHNFFLNHCRYLHLVSSSPWYKRNGWLGVKHQVTVTTLVSSQNVGGERNVRCVRVPRQDYFQVEQSSHDKFQTPSTALRHPSFNHCRM